MMHFRSYDALRLFVIVARHLSFTSASNELNLTKGAISYQIKQLERELGFKLFARIPSGIELTEKGQRLHAIAETAFAGIEQTISQLETTLAASITIGASSYFSSRWLAPRLASFMTSFPNVRLRLQPIIGPGDLQTDNLDMMIRWGKGAWRDAACEPLFLSPAIATAGQTVAELVAARGVAATLPQVTLLHDCEGSEAWREWYGAAGLTYRPKQDALVIHDPNVRVEAVVSGQGIALNDALVDLELETGRLVQILDVTLPAYGYFLAYRPEALNNPALRAFRDWILAV